MDLLMWLLGGSFCICILHPASSWQRDGENCQGTTAAFLLLRLGDKWLDSNQTRPSVITGVIIVITAPVFLYISKTGEIIAFKIFQKASKENNLNFSHHNAKFSQNIVLNTSRP